MLLLDLLLLVLERLLSIRFGERKRAGRVLRVDSDVEDARLPGVTVVRCDRLCGVFRFRKQDDSEPSTPAVGRVQGDVGAENGAAFAHEVFLLIGEADLSVDPALQGQDSPTA